MKLSSYFSLTLAIIVLASCTSREVPQKLQSDTGQVTQPHLKVVTLDDKSKIAMGQTIYVPVYSHIYYENQKKVLYLSATLSIRNTDLSNPIIITSVRYYDTGGKLIKQYLERPVELGSLASTDFVVERTDTSGGLGANFIVEWIAGKEVSEPVVEAVMISAVSSQGISFVSPGRVIKNHNNK
jgi:PBP1b-binding outer membrane lipoprotein LpoB